MVRTDNGQVATKAIVTYGIDVNLQLSGEGGECSRDRVRLLRTLKDASHGGGHTGRGDH